MIDILAGAFGSGKTEICLNMALDAAGEQPVLADLDIVNPFFCSREWHEELEAAGVQYIGPPRNMMFADLPYVTPQIVAFIRSDRRLFIDVGGDENGCSVLGYLSGAIAARPYRMCLVLNPYRPFTESEGKASHLRQALEKMSRLRFTEVISNPNLAADTQVEEIFDGHAMVAKMAQEMDLPIRFLAVEERLADELRSKLDSAVEAGLIKPVEICPVQMHLRPDWL